MSTKNEGVTLNRYVERGNEPNESFFEIKEFEDAPLKEGEIRLQTLYVSVDPYMRGRMNSGKSYVPPFEVGQPLTGSGIGRVIETKNEKYAVGDVLTSQKQLAWPFQTRVVFDDSTAAVYTKLDLTKVPKSLYSATIGFLGMPGLTAYFGLLDRGKPVAGETLVISGAAGACGSVAGQIGKILGLRVIGIAGSEDKVRYLLEELKFDAVINYKNKNRQQITEELKALAPNGVDIYYDNVGGEISNAVISVLNQNGRVPICGQISQYNNAQAADLPADLQDYIKSKNITRAWFMVMNYAGKFNEGWGELFQWVQEGKLKVKETFYEGIHSVPKAFLGLFVGDNIGKAVVKVSE